MLYLNNLIPLNITFLLHLTLTSVVFELRFWLLKATNAFYLTLTSVVFELDIKEKISKPDRNLTLTSVVFESHDMRITCIDGAYLTLTSVVFEYSYLVYYSLYLVFNFNKCCI